VAGAALILVALIGVLTAETFGIEIGPMVAGWVRTLAVASQSAAPTAPVHRR